MLVVGVQSFAVDRVSEKAGMLGIPLGGKAGEVGVQYLFSGLVSKLVLPTTTKWAFDGLDLGVPQDMVVHFP
jgi:hypothetical protein